MGAEGDLVDLVDARKNAKVTKGNNHAFRLDI